MDRACTTLTVLRPVPRGRYLGRTMLRVSLLLAWSLFVVPMAGQDGESLTDEFPDLSAKERSRIAKREAVEASRDVAFQAVMRTADGLFQEQRYQEALERYKEARRMRPYNVHPKVKVQDLQALLEQRSAAAVGGAGEEDDLPIPPIQERDTVVREAERPEVGTIAPVEVVRPNVDRRPPVRSPADMAVPGPRLPEPSTPSRQEGLEERRYREGRADVLERRVTSDGQTVTYKRVRHPWGAVFHFKDGEAISNTAWDQVFPEDRR